MKFERPGLGSILKRFRLIVPPNQREYSWEREDHVETLFDDLTKAISENAAEYFLGTIVAVEKTPGVLEIVDGQQRLATTVIFLCALRDYLKDVEQKVADHINTSFLSELDLTTKDDVPKLQLNALDNEFFSSLVKTGSVSAPQKPSHQRILDAFEAANKHIKKLVAAIRDKKDHVDILIKWISFIEHKALVVLLAVDNSSNAYKMFETLNDRGLKTSQADLVKNYLFGQSGDVRLSEAQQKWSLMRGALDSTFENDIVVIFLRHVLIMERGHLRESEVLDETESVARGSTKALSFLDRLEKYSNTYAALVSPGHDRWNRYPDSVNQAIMTLNQFKVQPMQPLLLAIAEKFPVNKASEAMKFLISLSVRLIIAFSTRSGSIEEALAETANLIFLDKITDTKGIKSNLSNITPKNPDFEDSFSTATVSKASFARYYLRSLEMALKDQPDPLFIPNADKETISLEHILPEKPQDNWKQFNQDEVDTYSRRIGNLALLVKKSNSDLRSADFETKKKVYAQSGGYDLTTQIVKLDEWTVEKIVERQKILAKLALKAWPI
jgi:hypothetical protein